MKVEGDGSNWSLLFSFDGAGSLFETKGRLGSERRRVAFCSERFGKGFSDGSLRESGTRSPQGVSLDYEGPVAQLVRARA